VAYARDTPSNLSYIRNEQLETLGISRAELRNIAVRNVEARLAGIQREDMNGASTVLPARTPSRRAFC
jgi:hypothetical protein